MYLTDIRGFTAEDNIAIFPTRECNIRNDEKLLLKAYGDTLLSACRSSYPCAVCKITIHGMGMLGDHGIPLHFASFCRIYNIEPRYLSMSDMGISFFVPSTDRERVLNALCEFFPMWE